MSAGTVIAMLAVLALGAATQRIAGLGLALVSAPVLSLLLGPGAGISVVNVATSLSSAMVLSQVIRHVDWHRYLRIGPLIVVGAIAGALVVRVVPEPWLEIVVGALVLIALGVIFATRGGLRIGGIVPAMVAGFSGGFMNTTAGIAGPAMTVYGLASRWEQRSFTATLQPIFLTAGVCSFAVKWAVGAMEPGQLVPGWVWPCIAAAIAAGVLAGGRLSALISAHRARAATVAIAAAGAVVALVRGLAAL